MNECVQELIDQAAGIRPTIINLVNAANWIDTAPSPQDQILENMVDAGDKLVVIAPSKMRKSFFVLQMALALAAHPRFLGWIIPKHRRVLYIQFEIREHHCWRRTRNLARSMGITSKDIGNRLMVINARGLGLSGKDGIDKIMLAVGDFKPEVIIFDPLYKISSGVENAAEDFKILLNAFDSLAEETGAAIIFVHHDRKGTAGDLDIRDRGSGSNVLGRDYDAAITLTPHAAETEAAVVDVILRNYPPQEPFAIAWQQSQETGGFLFELADDLNADRRTSRTPQATPSMESYLPVATEILTGGCEMETKYFKAMFQEKTRFSESKVNRFMSLMTGGDNPQLKTREERGYKLHKKWVSIPKVQK